ncbi:MAG: CRTAC1 family protein [Gammaproteobacteria bacterium]|nr:CRTAC1 family protein [Gammaproteobacteria bacterium]
MNNDEKQNLADELEPMEQDDAIIGQVFRWSLLVMIGLALIVLIVLFAGSREEQALPVAEAPLAGPEELAETGEQSPPQVGFSDMADEWGIKFVHENGAYGERLLPETMGSGVAIFDFDRDGDQDLFFVNGKSWPWQGESDDATQALYRNDGEQGFTDVSAATGVDMKLYGMGVVTADFDNDGWTDIFITAVGGNRLLRNIDGDHFVDVTAAAGVAGDNTAWSTAAVFFDADNDADLDLYVANYVEWSRDIDLEVDYQLTGIGRAFGPPANYAGTQAYFYLNNGDGSFSDRSDWVQVFNPATGQAMGKGLAVVPIDLNHDGWMDLVVANDTVRNFAFENLQGHGFRELGLDLGLAFDNAGHATGAMGMDVAAYGNNGDLAVAIGNFANEMTSFYVAQQGSTLFTDEAILAGIGPLSRKALSFGLFFFDYDLDGRLDFFQTNGHVEPEINIVQPSQNYRQASQLFWQCGEDCQRQYVPVAETQVGDLAIPVVGRGAAYGDLDGDGDLDIVITQSGDRPIVLRNDQRGGQHWLRVHLDPSEFGQSPIGAVVTLSSGGVTQQRTLNPTRSYLSQMELVLTFGLGTNPEIDGLWILWPDGRSAEVSVPGVDREIKVAWPDKDGVAAVAPK